MSLKNVRYTRLETEESEGDEDETPPTHVEVNNESPHIKGDGQARLSMEWRGVA